jgi:RNA polymerase sigma-70 factor (ECF subfamily)
MDGDWLSQEFEDNRGHLRAVAFRMLGSAAEADDAVQEALERVAPPLRRREVMRLSPII